GISRFAVLHADGQGSQRRSQSAEVRQRRQSQRRAATATVLPARADALSPLRAAQSGTKLRTEKVERALRRGNLKGYLKGRSTKAREHYLRGTASTNNRATSGASNCSTQAKPSAACAACASGER